MLIVSNGDKNVNFGWLRLQVLGKWVFQNQFARSASLKWELRCTSHVFHLILKRFFHFWNRNKIALKLSANFFVLHTSLVRSILVSFFHLFGLKSWAHLQQLCIQFTFVCLKSPVFLSFRRKFYFACFGFEKFRSQLGINADQASPLLI